jgi:CO/xanthine dehydrogenase Mo-binding subunit
MTKKTMQAGVSTGRRNFLKSGGAMVVTFSLPAGINAATDPAAATPAKSVASDRVEGFLAIDAKGRVTVYSGKVDLGTGIETAMAQIAAEELSVPLDSVTVIQGDTLLTPDQGITWGSLSIQVGGMQIRQAAATARQALLTEGAAKLGMASDAVGVRDGVVVPKAGGKGVSYAALVGGKDFTLAVDAKAPLKDPSAYTIVGQSVPRVDIPDKVTGRFIYMQDFKRKGMLHARVVRPAGIKATLQSMNDFDCHKIPGYVGVVKKGNFVAVLARTEWAAIVASRALSTTWSDWSGLPDQAKLWEYVRGIKVVKDEDLQKVGDAAQALKTPNAKIVKASYDFGIHTHGSIGPSCAVAEYVDGNLTVWCASQQNHLLRKQLSNMLGMKPENIRCIYIEGAGCYGRNGHEDAAADAALIAREVGLPVRVQWMRHDEHGWDPKGPPMLYDFTAALDDSGGVIGWQGEAYLPDRPKDFAVTLLSAELAGLPYEPSHPGNIFNSLGIPYTFPNVRAVAHWVAETPLRPSWIRTPGRMQNTFANECFMDEVAIAAGADPLEFRLKNLNDPRGAELLRALAELASWKPTKREPPTGDVARGRGVAYTKYELARTYVGVVADVEVNVKTGKVIVTKSYVAHDCGQIINPDGLRNQIEGNVVQTVSRTLLEEVKFDRSRVTSVDWVSYPILKFPEVPDVAIKLIDRPTEKPWGAGEPTAAVVPSAIANAIYNATGARVRSVPFTPEKVQAALKTI